MPQARGDSGLTSVLTYCQKPFLTDFQKQISDIPSEADFRQTFRSNFQMRHWHCVKQQHEYIVVHLCIVIAGTSLLGIVSPKPLELCKTAT